MNQKTISYAYFRALKARFRNRYKKYKKQLQYGKVHRPISLSYIEEPLLTLEEYFPSFPQAEGETLASKKDYSDFADGIEKIGFPPGYKEGEVVERMRKAMDSLPAPASKPEE
jgi:hypothetical protein